MFKPQFSLLNVMLATALGGLILALVLYRREIASLHTEREKVLDETGYIDVQDPSKVYVRDLFCPAPFTRQVRVYLPPGHRLEAGIRAGLAGSPPADMQLVSDTNLHAQGTQLVFTFALDQEQGHWWFSKKYAHNGLSARVPGDYSYLFERFRESNQVFHPEHGPVHVYDPDEAIPLLTLSPDQPATKSGSTSPPAAGELVVWMERDLKARFDRAKAK